VLEEITCLPVLFDIAHNQAALEVALG